MLSIVMHHYVVNSGLLQLMCLEPLNYKSIYLYFIGMWGKTGINCFVLITGYFMCKKEITLYKFLKLILEVEFYNIAIYFIFLITGYTGFSIGKLLWTFVPIHNIETNFTSCYLIFFLFIPFLNILVRNMTKKTHGLLVLLFLSIYTLWQIIPFVEIRLNYVTWFCILYFIGSYIRLYPFKKDQNTKFWFYALFLSITSAFISIIAILLLNKYSGHIFSPFFWYMILMQY